MYLFLESRPVNERQNIRVVQLVYNTKDTNMIVTEISIRQRAKYKDTQKNIEFKVNYLDIFFNR